MKIVESTKSFVRRNKTRVLITTTAISTAVAVVQYKAVNQHNEFLKDHDLYAEYHYPTAPPALEE